MRQFFGFSLFSLILVGLAIRFLSIQPNPLTVNRISFDVMKGMMYDPGVLVDLKPELTSQAKVYCDSNWTLGLVLGRLGD
jgi:hypothetical protein